MCAKCGVDPLASNKGFWAELLGIGDFYYELGKNGPLQVFAGFTEPERVNLRNKGAGERSGLLERPLAVVKRPATSSQFCVLSGTLQSSVAEVSRHQKIVRRF